MLEMYFYGPTNLVVRHIHGDMNRVKWWLSRQSGIHRIDVYDEYGFAFRVCPTAANRAVPVV